MAPAEQLEPGRVVATAPAMATAPEPIPAPVHAEPVEVAKEELNSWRRGFTPQAELWNGRLAMLGLSIGLTVLLLSRLLG